MRLKRALFLPLSSRIRVAIDGSASVFARILEESGLSDLIPLLATHNFDKTIKIPGFRPDFQFAYCRSSTNQGHFAT